MKMRIVSYYIRETEYCKLGFEVFHNSCRDPGTINRSKCETFSKVPFISKLVCWKNLNINCTIRFLFYFLSKADHTLLRCAVQVLTVPKFNNNSTFTSCRRWCCVLATATNNNHRCNNNHCYLKSQP